MEASVHIFTTVYQVGVYVQPTVVFTVSVHPDDEMKCLLICINSLFGVGLSENDEREL